MTLEGLIKAPPGRYLALRIRLSGTSRSSPAVLAVRASYQRPSLLDHLPSYWRADPVTADATDRALALFEGWITETDARVTALPELADPRLVPTEALDWLASYVALTFDQRLSEPVRRQLLLEISKLYRQRGTLPGLTRLLSILAQAPVIIVEGFKLRRQAAVFLDNTASVIGPGLQLGDNEGAGATDDPADVALAQAHIGLLLRRAQTQAAGGTPCPLDDPPDPIETDPLARFVRRFAHRFTVILPCHRDSVLEGVIQDAVEANKPAHTLHMLCWLDAGFQLGRSSYAGVARLGSTPCFEPGLLGTAVLGTQNTIGAYRPDLRFRLGQPLSRDHRSISERTAGP
jgi:phage tail-like protein